MTKIGRQNPLVRLARAAASVVQPREPGAGAALPTWVIGHRGAARVAPENTIESYGRAVELGADGVEADICVTRDGHFVVWHDADPGENVALARQAGREELAFTPDVPDLGSTWRRAVCDLTLLEFRRHYGYCRRRGGVSDLIADDAPPSILAITLSELLAWADRESRARHVVFDVKLVEGQEDRAVELLERLRARVQRPEARADLQFHYLTPQREIIEPLAAHVRVKPLPPQLDLFADFELPGALETVEALGLRNVSMGSGQRVWNEFRDEVATVARERGRGRLDRLVVWTINDAERLRDLVSLGVDGILTDDSAALRAIVDAAGGENAGSGERASTV